MIVSCILFGLDELIVIGVIALIAYFRKRRSK